MGKIKYRGQHRAEDRACTFDRGGGAEHMTNTLDRGGSAEHMADILRRSDHAENRANTLDRGGDAEHMTDVLRQGALAAPKRTRSKKRDAHTQLQMLRGSGLLRSVLITVLELAHVHAGLASGLAP